MVFRLNCRSRFWVGFFFQSWSFVGTWGGGPARRRSRRCVFSVSDKNSLRIVSSILACVRMVMMQYAVQMFQSPPPHRQERHFRLRGSDFLVEHRLQVRFPNAAVLNVVRTFVSLLLFAARIFFLFSETRIKAGGKKRRKTCWFCWGVPTEMCHGPVIMPRHIHTCISHTRPRKTGARK